MIGILDYGMGNLSSVSKAVKFLGYDAIISNKKNELLACDGLILPGVGAFADAIKNIEEAGLDLVITDFVKTGKPFLGICLGLQLLFENSEEGLGRGLCLLEGEVKLLPAEIKLKIPHMGWNYLNMIKENKVFKGIEKKTYVYFVHSYYIEAKNREDVIGRASYGIDFDIAVNKDNIWAFQFHPEKSGDRGLAILKNWLDLTTEGKCS